MSHLLNLARDGSNDPALLAHIADLVRASAENNSGLKGLSQLEIFSHFLREHKFKFQEFLPDRQLAAKVGAEKQYQQYVKQLGEITSHLQRLEDGRAYQRPDLMQEHAALKTAGVSIGQTTAFHLNKVIKALAVEYQTRSIRYWGKILGGRDYYVIQGTGSKTYLAELGENGEKYGTGVNTYSYWVATDILGKWSQLPLVTPEQVAGSRGFKYIFTGDLQRSIVNGHVKHIQEKHLLKCIVARITHSCELVPKGLYKPSQENPQVIDFEDEFRLPEVAEFANLEAWVHLNPNILQQGRCSHYIDPKLSEEQKEALTAELAEKDPLLERLKGVAEDKPYEALGFTTNWSVSISGETVPVNQIGKQEGTSLVYGVAVLRNLVWPGAVTVGYRGGWTSIYVGYGHRISQQFNMIRELKDLALEAQERAQRSEPNPSKAPEQKKQQVPPPE